MTKIRSGVGEGRQPAGVGGAGGGAMAGLGRGWPSGRSRALEKELIAPDVAKLEENSPRAKPMSERDWGALATKDGGRRAPAQFGEG